MKTVVLRSKVWGALESVADAVEDGLGMNMPYNDQELVEAAVWLAAGTLREMETAEKVAEVLADCHAEVSSDGDQGLLYPYHLCSLGPDHPLAKRYPSGPAHPLAKEESDA